MSFGFSFAGAGEGCEGEGFATHGNRRARDLRAIPAHPGSKAYAYTEYVPIDLLSIPWRIDEPPRLNGSDIEIGWACVSCAVVFHGVETAIVAEANGVWPDSCIPVELAFRKLCQLAYSSPPLLKTFPILEQSTDAVYGPTIQSGAVGSP